MEHKAMLFLLFSVGIWAYGHAAKGPACHPVFCRMYCPNGYAKDPVTGCEICKCAKPCRPTICMMKCPNGFKTDQNGCKLCQCKPECSGAMCSMYCPFGFEKDANGCPMCRCKSRPPGGCPKIRCMMECPGGFVRRHGCPICRCKRIRRPQTCKKRCPTGQVCRKLQINCFAPPCPGPLEVCRRSHKACGDNQVFNHCTSACRVEPTCENPNPTPHLGACIQSCVPKCVCASGFIKSEQAGKCIGEGQCPQN